MNKNIDILDNPETPERDWTHTLSDPLDADPLTYVTESGEYHPTIIESTRYAIGAIKDGEGEKLYPHWDGISNAVTIGSGLNLDQKHIKQAYIKLRSEELVRDEGIKQKAAEIKSNLELKQFQKDFKLKETDPKRVYGPNKKTISSDLNHRLVEYVLNTTVLKEVDNIYGNFNLNYLQRGVISDLYYQAPAYVKKGTAFYKAVKAQDWDKAIYEIAVKSNPGKANRKPGWLGIANRHFSRVRDLDIARGGDGSANITVNGLNYNARNELYLPRPKIKPPPPSPRPKIKPPPPMDPILEHHYRTIAQGNAVKNEDGSLSTVYTRQIDINGVPTLIPSVWDGKILSEKDAKKRAVKSGVRWPTRETHEELRAYDVEMHKEMTPISPEQAQQVISKSSLQEK